MIPGKEGGGGVVQTRYPLPGSAYHVYKMPHALCAKVPEEQIPSIPNEYQHC